MPAFPNLFMNVMILTRVSIDEDLVSGSTYRYPAAESGLDKASIPGHALQNEKHLSHARQIKSIMLDVTVS
jgi:hypothetical protein